MKILRYLPFFSVIVIALCIRVTYNLTAGVGYAAMYDAAQYERIGLHILNQRCFCDVSHISTLGRAPLWPGVIAFIYALFGSDNITVRLFLSFLGSLTCVLIYCFACDLFGKRFGFIAGIIAACYPGLFIYDGWLYSESLYTFCFLAFTYTLYRFQRTLQTRWVILSGIALACSMLTRQNGLFTYLMLAVFVLIVGWKRILSWRVATRGVIWLTLISCVLILPWAVRNYIVSHEIVPISTGSSTILAGAYNNTVFTNPMLGATGMWVPPDAATPPIQYKEKCCNIWGEDPNQQTYAFNWMSTHTQSLPRLLALHFINIWKSILPDGAPPISQFPERLSSRLITQGLHYGSILVIAFAAIGLVVTWRRKWKELLPLYLTIAITIVQCVVLYGSVRFRAPIEPMLVILATGAIWWVWQSLFLKRTLSRASIQRRVEEEMAVEQESIKEDLTVTKKGMEMY